MKKNKFKLGIKGLHKRAKQVNFSLFKKNEPLERATRALKWFNEVYIVPNVKSNVVNCWSLSDCQINTNPYAFFLVHPQLIKDNAIDQRELKTRTNKNFWFPSQIIYNAKIIEAPKKIKERVAVRELEDPKDKKNLKTKIASQDKMVSNIIEVKEGCASFPDRKPKIVKRYYRIKVSYQIRTWYGYKTVIEWVEGLKSHIFQHEIEHSQGKNIYNAKPNT
jgi:hypothetical protein